MIVPCEVVVLLPGLIHKYIVLFCVLAWLISLRDGEPRLSNVCVCVVDHRSYNCLVKLNQAQFLRSSPLATTMSEGAVRGRGRLESEYYRDEYPPLLKGKRTVQVQVECRLGLDVKVERGDPALFIRWW